MAERNDAIRDITDGSSANLIAPRGYGEVSIDEQQVEQKKQAEKDEMRAHMQAIMLSEKQHKIQEMAGRDAVLRDETTIINMKREVEEAEQEKVDIFSSFLFIIITFYFSSFLFIITFSVLLEKKKKKNIGRAHV
eukprot:727175_1